MSEYFELLATKLKSGNLAAFLGAGVSKTYSDVCAKKCYQGLLSASDIVKELIQEKKYLTEDLSFEQAFFLIKKKEGRIELENIIRRLIDKPGTHPLPAHKLLANMPFSAFLTTNFDTLTEKALIEAKKSYTSIIDNDDVPRWGGTQLPLIKLHGCVTRPDTLVAAEDEYIPLSLKKPVVEALVKVLLSNKTALFLGFSLRDTDFRIIYNELESTLKDHMPKSYAIVHSAANYEIDYWEAKGIKIIQYDLTEFLNGLLEYTLRQRKPSIYHKKDDWMNNAYFRTLTHIRTSPSETQAIDAFLTHLQEEVVSDLPCRDILDSASMAIGTILSSKPNFEAFTNLWSALKPMLEKAGEKSKECLEEALEEYISTRERIATNIGKKCRDVVRSGDNILIFSQSIRVINILRSVQRRIQRSCKLYVCECRPKSPEPFQDAYALCESLKDTDYHITIIPDVCTGNLISRKQINKVIMGAHSIYIENNTPVSFVNTCGSLMITTISDKYNIPLFIVAESEKCKNVGGDAPPNISYVEEESIFDEGRMAVLKAGRSQEVSHLNIGYDLCPCCKNITIISEI
jgi:translation initiation factor 2B subunit (eIF-2B alpha/beta/delta family)